MKEFAGSLVHKERLRQGLTLKQLALKAGLADSTILLMEGGAKEPKVNTLAAVAEALGKPISGFFL